LGISFDVDIESFRGLFLGRQQFPIDTECFVPLPEITQHKLNQRRKFKRSIRRSDHKLALNLVFSNDLKNIIVKEDKVLPHSRNALVKWSNMSIDRKACFNPKRDWLFPKSTEQEVKIRVDKLMDDLLFAYQFSGTEVVFISSVLERCYTKGALIASELFVALVNFFIYRYIEELRLKPPLYNRNGQLLKVHFINVARLYYSEEDKFKLFIPKEITKGAMVHRNMYI
jgi:hypothetical protein